MRVRLSPIALENIVDSISGAYNLRERIEELEIKIKQLESDIKVLYEITDKIRPKYYPIQKEEEDDATR
jgi:chromosome segregation ATPase